MEKTNEDRFREQICDLEYEGWIDHATMTNALNYVNGTYAKRNHKLCRNAFMRCMDFYKK